MAVSGKAIAEGDSIRGQILKAKPVPPGMKTTIVNKALGYDETIHRMAQKGVEYTCLEDTPYRQVWGCDIKEFEAMIAKGTAHRKSLVERPGTNPVGRNSSRKKGTAMRLEDLGNSMPETEPAPFVPGSGAIPEE